MEDLFRLENKFRVDMKRIIGEALIKDATFKMDTKQATDMYIMGLNNVNISCRIRTYNYYKLYPYDFTIRCETKYNTKTEFDKILAGHCDYNLYAFCDARETKLIKWHVGSWDAFRIYMNEFVTDDIPRTLSKIPNGDGTKFYAFDYRNIDNYIVKLK